MAKLYFNYSAMNAGKSTICLQSSYNYQERGMETLLYLPSIDTRFRSGIIHSRIGLKGTATPIDSDFNLFESVKTYLNVKHHNIRCVLVDEAQFLSKAQVLQLTDIADILGLPVLAYGLRSDYMGEPFEGSKYLLALAEELIEIKTICHCGSKAIMNVRIDSDGKQVTSGSQIHIGGNESYVATCRKHFKNGETGHQHHVKEMTIAEESVNE